MTIVTDPHILRGKPIIEGTRISVEFILELLSSGIGIGEILKEYPQLKKEDVLEAVTYARKILGNEEIVPLSS